MEVGESDECVRNPCDQKKSFAYVVVAEVPADVILQAVLTYILNMGSCSFLH